MILAGGSGSFNYVDGPTPADVILPRDFVSNPKSQSEIHHPTTPRDMQELSTVLYAITDPTSSKVCSGSGLSARDPLLRYRLLYAP